MNRITSILLLITLFMSPVLGNAKRPDNKNKTARIIPFSKMFTADIGAKTQHGNSSLKNERIIMKAGGADVWGTNDEFRFGYVELKGDFDVSVQVLNLTKPHLYTKAGIMARTDLSDNSRHVYFQVFPDNSARNNNNGGAEFQYREEKGGEMKAIYPNQETAGSKFDVNFPDTWIRLTREGDVFKSYMSSDSNNWHLYSTYQQKMPKKLLVGLAVTSHNSSEMATAGFSLLHLNKN